MDSRHTYYFFCGIICSFSTITFWQLTEPRRCGQYLPYTSENFSAMQAADIVILPPAGYFFRGNRLNDAEHKGHIRHIGIARFPIFCNQTQAVTFCNQFATLLNHPMFQHLPIVNHSCFSSSQAVRIFFCSKSCIFSISDMIRPFLQTLDLQRIFLHQGLSDKSSNLCR